MERRKNKRKCPAIAEWMTTFTDMTTLLLTFFILMFTTAEIDGNELRLILSSFASSFGIMPGGLTLQKGPLAQSGMTVESLPSTQAAQKLSKAFHDFTSEFKIKTTKNFKDVRLTENNRGLVISIPGRVFFHPDDANLKPEGMVLLDQVVNLLLDIKNNSGIDTQVEIEGHSSIEPNTLGFSGLSSIWEHNLDLSIDRAKNVEKFFIKRFKEIAGALPIIRKTNGRQVAKFVSKGYGEFQPYEDSNSPESRSWNRRVDIVVNRN